MTVARAGKRRAQKKAWAQTPQGRASRKKARRRYRKRKREEAQAELEGLRGAAPVVRRCLRCPTEFESEGPQWRLCPSCRKVVGRMTDGGVPVHQLPEGYGDAAQN